MAQWEAWDAPDPKETPASLDLLDQWESAAFQGLKDREVRLVILDSLVCPERMAFLARRVSVDRPVSLVHKVSAEPLE